MSIYTNETFLDMFEQVTYMLSYSYWRIILSHVRTVSAASPNFSVGLLVAGTCLCVIFKHTSFEKQLTLRKTAHSFCLVISAAIVCKEELADIGITSPRTGLRYLQPSFNPPADTCMEHFGMQFLSISVNSSIHHLQSSVAGLPRYNPPRRLRSSDSSLPQVPRSQCSWRDCSLSHAGPTLLNNISLALRQPVLSNNYSKPIF